MRNLLNSEIRIAIALSIALDLVFIRVQNMEVSTDVKSLEVVKIRTCSPGP
jgi:hypothetical protein